MTWSKISGAGLVASRHNKLEIAKTTYNDSGTYVCTASNILGEVQKQAKLFVEGKMIKTVKISKCKIKIRMTCSVATICFLLTFDLANQRVLLSLCWAVWRILRAKMEK